MTQRGEELAGEVKFVVFCVDGRKYDRPGYTFFTHEADVIAAAVANEVKGKHLTPAEGREVLEPYREVLPPLFTGEQSMVFDPDRSGWDDPGSFPRADAILASPPASQIFWYEADELGIDGVNLVWQQPFPVLEPVSEEALEELRGAVADEYEIVVKQTLEAYDATRQDLAWAGALLDTAKRSEPGLGESFSNESRAVDGTGIQLIYGYDGQGGLVFFEEKFAIETQRFRRGLFEATTWGELKAMIREEDYRETVGAWLETERDRLEDEAEDCNDAGVNEPGPGDPFDADRIWGYADGDWPGMPQRAMTNWVEAKLIVEYGEYVETVLNGFYPVIKEENGEKVAAILAGRGYTCVHDDDRVWEAIYGG